MSEFWSTHSPITRPGEDAVEAIAALPSDIPSLHHAANQLVLHYRARASEVLPERQHEIHTRYADAMLTRVFSRGPGATLSQDRGPLDQTVGCCRDSAVLLVALARSKGYAARARVGFAAYFDEPLMLDHVVAEIWDPALQRWRLVDADVGLLGDDKVNVLDLRPGIDFQTAPHAWALLRAGKIKDEDVEQRYTCFRGAPAKLCGKKIIAHNAVHDLAALDKKELLLWEEWGMRAVEHEVTAAEAALLDEVAAVIAHQDIKVDDMQALMAREDLKIPDEILLYDPYASDDPPKVIDISRALRG